jgi:hypothetical protein
LKKKNTLRKFFSLKSKRSIFSRQMKEKEGNVQYVYEMCEKSVCILFIRRVLHRTNELGLVISIMIYFLNVGGLN